jgi:DNA-binding NtrC family response regulator
MITQQTDSFSRILIIGSDESQTRDFADALASEFQISAAPGVLDAVERIKKNTFSTIIFDLADGETLITDDFQALQQDAPYTPIIVTSVQQDADVVVKAVKAGAFDFITKPFSTEKLKLAVYKALENRSLKNEIKSEFEK